MNNITNFSDSSADLETRRYTVPLVVSVTKNPNDQTREQIINRQEKFLKLPEEIKDKLVSPETSEIIQDIGKIFNLQLLQLADISRAIRSYYFGEIKLEDFPNILAKEMLVDINTAQQISKRVIEKIINDNSLGVNRSLINLPLPQALKQYSQLGEQLISSGGIKLKYFASPVRPSIKNWIADYNEVMGVENHDMMKRGDYLFHSENGKRLTTGERQKVSEILKSFDEGSMLSVDPQRQEVVFENRNQEPRINNNQEINRKAFPLPPTPLPKGGGELKNPFPQNSYREPIDTPLRPASVVQQPPRNNYPEPIARIDRQAAFDQLINSGSRLSENGNQPTASQRPATINRQPATNNYQPPSINQRPSANSINNDPLVQTDFFSAQNRPAERNYNNAEEEKNSNINFSSAHRFPVENNIPKNNNQENFSREKKVPQEAARTVKNKYIINPHLDPDATPDTTPKIQGNVVDLRQ